MPIPDPAPVTIARFPERSTPSITSGATPGRGAWAALREAAHPRRRRADPGHLPRRARQRLRRASAPARRS